MVFVCYFLLGFLAVQLMVALMNAVFIQRLETDAVQQDDMISVLIPARNEEKNIAVILNDLLIQNYQNIEIVVFNDQSTDATESIVNEFTQKDKRIKLANSHHLPEGWLGKNFACHSLSEMASGKYYLFLDADVRVYNDIITKTVSWSKKHKLGLISIFPKQIMQTFGEKITVPIMNYILLTLLPLILVRKSRFSSLAAANGQFMLFEAEIYKKMSPHWEMKNKRVEDIEISRFYKKNKIKIACLTGKADITCRMYQNYKEAVNGFSKNVISFFSDSFIVAIIFWLITTFGFIPVLFFLSVEFFLFYIFAFLLIRILVSYASCQHMGENLYYSLIQQIVLGKIIFQSIINKKNNKQIWKERNVS